MRYFLDTEFIEAGHLFPLTLLSIGIVAEDGREFYAVNAEADHTVANDWVKENVLPYLGKERQMRHVDIGHAILAFVGEDKPEFWGYYADYDWVVFCQLFGSMIGLPTGWPMYCRDLKQLCDQFGNPKLPEQGKGEHNALADARWNRIAYQFLQRLDSERADNKALLDALKAFMGLPHLFDDMCVDERPDCKVCAAIKLARAAIEHSEPQ